MDQTKRKAFPHLSGQVWALSYAINERNEPPSVTSAHSTRDDYNAFGIGCLTGSLGVALLLAIACHVTFLFVISAEESYLENTFGQPIVITSWACLAFSHASPVIRIQKSWLFVRKCSIIYFLTAWYFSSHFHFLKPSNIYSLQASFRSCSTSINPPYN